METDKNTGEKTMTEPTNAEILETLTKTLEELKKTREELADLKQKLHNHIFGATHPSPYDASAHRKRTDSKHRSPYEPRLPGGLL